MSSAKSASTRLLHILHEIDGIASVVSGLQAVDIASDYMRLRAFERGIQIISEAVKKLPAELRDRYPQAPWRAIIGIGNLLRHEYHRISPAEIHDIATRDLPELRPVIASMLADLANSK